MAVRILPKYTYEDYKNWQGDWQLIDGNPFAIAPSPMKRHRETWCIDFERVYGYARRV